MSKHARAYTPAKGNEHEGYHQWKHDETDTTGKVVGQTETGSFEVFYHDKNDDDLAMNEPGWYWWACFPGCLPDGEPSGPFATSKEAYDDAMGG